MVYHQTISMNLRFVSCNSILMNEMLDYYHQKTDIKLR
jgi:hypothetical protein